MKPPDDLRATVIREGDLRLVVLSWPAEAAEDPPTLSPAEVEIAGLVLAGHSRATIARLRGTAPGTVAKQIERIYERLGVSSRTELASALAAGLRHGTEP